MEGGETGRKLMLEMGMKGRERAQKQGSSQRYSEGMDEDVKNFKKKGFKTEGKEKKKGRRSEGRKEGMEREMKKLPLAALLFRSHHIFDLADFSKLNIHATHKGFVCPSGVELGNLLFVSR